ncbi:uncharacterized protein BDZ99DRAFT_474742 [Mytilinidion resinicola]|uniref:DH domain-containing protein n=1 Tax=Mytilinidion resinicola TaxID=574789 RepID=A0A6A6YUG2_9PEZI|nr:uncharacterized protein BDZ99DRAFT_474742 [Mytilinidion resinicola]KAF2812596.1 hypothetical protein BDZ99DRAFT_474742 [Mytilinidion resinicola]
MHTQSHQSYASQYSNWSHSTARDTQSSAATSTSTLFNPPFPTATPVNNGGPIEASDSVLNRRADKDTSLFQICLNLQTRLRKVPGFGHWLVDETADADDDTDPVTILWRTFRRGYPLMDIYNALNPGSPLVVDEGRIPEKKRPQAATFKFIQACMNEFKFPAAECFIITDLYGDDTTGFVKVAKVVNRVLDILVQCNVISEEEERFDESNAPGVKRTQRQHIVDEMVKTERTYVQHLELLQAFKTEVERRGIVTGDCIHDIFLNLNALLDFQRRFLIRVEQTNAQPEEEQNWGKLFVLYKDAFKVYEPYIANQKKCEDTATREFVKLKDTGGSDELRQMVESSTVLTSFLLKPFQRLAKYPLLLKELRDKGDLDDSRKQDISNGIEAASSVLQRTNAAIDREERLEAVEELRTLVEDWKGHRIEGFGELLLYGTFTVLKGESISTKNEEREYKIYLFEMILLCCKEQNPNKQKNRITNKSLTNSKGKAKLQLKGRIFMQNVTETISISKPGSYTCQIFWKGDPGIENFVIRFQSEETMKKWAAQVDGQRRVWRDHARSSSRTNTSASATEFTFMQNQPNLVNPYAEEEEDDEEEPEDHGAATPATQEGYAIRSNGSSVSLRSRSTTGDSGPPMAEADPRVPPPRFPMGYESQPALTLRTQQLAGATTPGTHPESFFSPTVDSPISSRTSSSSAGMFPFPRQQAPPNAWHGEDSNRFTAPAMARQMSREGSMGPGAYPGGRNNAMQRPSLPPNAGSQHSAVIAQNRMRSASSPDIHNPLRQGQRQNGQQPPVPELPPFPTHYAYAPGIVNRSQNNSPNSMPQPQRAATQSPNIARERFPQQPRSQTEMEPSNGSNRYDPRHVPMPRTMTPASSFDRTMTPASVDSRTMSPPLPQSQDVQIPSQLKVKVHCPSAGSTMTLVVSTNISFQSLKDRIDAKLQRSTNVSLSAGQVKLKYLDEDDYVSIQSDEDVQTAFETWKEQQRDQIMAGQLGEIELFCQR